jgi:hypothetical protein
MGEGKKEKVKKDDLENSWCGDKKRSIRDGGKEGQYSEKDQGDKTIDVDQEGS